MDILDALFDEGKPPTDESDMPTESSVLKDYDALVALLTYPSWKGEPRELATLTIGYSHHAWYARLNDVDNRRSITGDGKTVYDAIESLSSILMGGATARWYKWPGSPTKPVAKSATSSNGSAGRKKSRGGSK